MGTFKGFQHADQEVYFECEALEDLGIPTSDVMGIEDCSDLTLCQLVWLPVLHMQDLHGCSVGLLVVSTCLCYQPGLIQCQVHGEQDQLGERVQQVQAGGLAEEVQQVQAGELAGEVQQVAGPVHGG